MTNYIYPDIQAAEEVAMLLGVPVGEILKEPQDWEYAFPEAEDLDRYVMVYEGSFLSKKAKRLLGVFIFQALENHLEAGGSPKVAASPLDLLLEDIDIHQPEFDYWAMEHVTDEAQFFLLTPYVRKALK